MYIYNYFGNPEFRIEIGGYSVLNISAWRMESLRIFAGKGIVCKVCYKSFAHKVLKGPTKMLVELYEQTTSKCLPSLNKK